MTGESSKKLARRLNARQFDAYSQEPPTRPEWTAARAGLVAVSVALMLLVAIAFVTGLVLVLQDFPSLSIVPGVLLIAIAWTLRPRVGRAGTNEWAIITRDDAPALFTLIDRVAAATGAPQPHHVALDYEFNASAGIFGLRRKRQLVLGLPLWGILRPQQRVALLGHEFGHFVNNDSARGLLTQSALTTPGAIAYLLTPAESLTGGPLTAVAEAVLRPIQRLLSRLFVLMQVGLIAVASRDHQRAEYCADAMAVRLAGTEATVALMHYLMAGEQLLGAVSTVERGIHSNPKTAKNHPGVAPWRAAADQTRSQFDLPALLEKSIEEDASLWSEHPPSGLRARIVESWPHAEPSLVLTQEDSDKIDAELQRYYAKAGRDLVWS
ncbi:M48 family metallopeptidase [Lentzea sp. NBRC 105346]|uniref:M48 family metallopeptidase n=1 Tax=Lentzea sp. NBRC 105346 TaxID=3032205 RepID=UPI0025551C16|nr:M48 family metallopeptidase [Lentzea sp. NBRC 105346]